MTRTKYEKWAPRTPPVRFYNLLKKVYYLSKRKSVFVTPVLSFELCKTETYKGDHLLIQMHVQFIRWYILLNKLKFTKWEKCVLTVLSTNFILFMYSKLRLRVHLRIYVHLQFKFYKMRSFCINLFVNSSTIKVIQLKHDSSCDIQAHCYKIH